MADSRWRMADGRWRMADSEWQMADGRWRMADGKESCKNNSRVSTTPDRSGCESARIKFGKTCQVWREDSGTCFYMSPKEALWLFGLRV
jgi:hypothetical protein